MSQWINKRPLLLRSVKAILYAWSFYNFAWLGHVFVVLAKNGYYVAKEINPVIASVEAVLCICGIALIFVVLMVEKRR
jgi:hypothetical protein